MLEVLINIVPHGDITQRKPAAGILITNELTTADDTTGNYTYALTQYPACGQPTIRSGRVVRHPRSAGALELVRSVLMDALDEPTDDELHEIRRRQWSIANGTATVDDVILFCEHDTNKLIYKIVRLRTDIERIGRERDQMVAANVELQERLSALENDGK